MDYNIMPACSQCAYKCQANHNGKLLRKCTATSILCETTVLEECNRVRLVAENEDNKYFHIIGSNSVIMHVEDSFCILLDYKVQTFNSSGEMWDLTMMLSARHYCVYQINNRDWIMNSNSRAIGHDIQDLVHGNGAKMAREKGMTLDHGAETYNEKLVNCKYKNMNVNEGSHRRRENIQSQEELEGVVDRVIQKGETPGFIK